MFVLADACLSDDGVETMGLVCRLILHGMVMLQAVTVWCLSSDIGGYCLACYSMWSLELGKRG